MRGVASTGTSPLPSASAMSASVTSRARDGGQAGSGAIAYHTQPGVTGHLVIDDAVLQRTVSTALQQGGDFAEVFAEDRRSTALSLDDSKVEVRSRAGSRLPGSG